MFFKFFGLSTFDISPNSKDPDNLGENVLPKLYFSAEGDLGGVCPWAFGLWGVLIFERKMGEGGVIKAEPGFSISVMSVLMSLSVVPKESHFTKSESICPLAI